LPLQARLIASGALAVIWIVAWIEARADWRRLLAELSAGGAGAVDPTVRSDHWIRQAQAAYLSGDWVSAEQTLLKLLRQDARDAEARLMLATLWRHQDRTAAASEQLDRLETLETAAPWRYEVAGERERIAAASVKRLPTELSASAEPSEQTIEASKRRLAA
jgi:hypothetical protein